MSFLSKLFQSDNPMDKFYYSDKWLKNATMKQLETEREKVRLAFCDAKHYGDIADFLRRTLYRFDDEMGRRVYGDRKPKGPAFHREHGWYLKNGD